MRKRIAWLVTTGLVASSLAIPGIAAAHTNEAIAETGGMMLTLPGVGVNVDVVLDEFGNISEVGVVDLADPEPGDAGGPLDAHKVRFEIDEDGTRLSVMAKKHKLTSKVQAGSLAELAGVHDWSAVLFPDQSGDPTTVTFTVNDDGGDPSITDVGVEVPPSGADDPEIIYTVSEGDDDDDEDAMVVITFSWNGYTKTLKIKVDVDDDDDDDGPSAVLKIELRAKDRQRLRGPLADFVGDHTWNGRLCDNTEVSVPYNIGPDGELTVTPGEGYSVKDQERGFQVTFDGSKARLHVKFGETDDGTWDLKVDAKTTEKCKHNPNRGKKDKPDKAERRDRDGDDHDDGDDEEEDDDD
ncbi:MAG: hypothetical protein ACR2OI_04770 [Acidimicrobiia bacterium]